MIIGFEDEDTTYAKLLIKLKHEGITKRQFFRGVVASFLQDDPAFLDYIVEFKKRKNLYVKSKQKVLDKERSVSESTEKKFGLSEEDVEDIFDILEEEMGL
jgi:hypothetical protein